jgi:DNA transformation protein
MRKPKPRPPVLLQAIQRLSPLGGIVDRPMFGGYALYLDGVIFALVFADTLYFKVDDVNRPDYEKAGMAAFEYQTDSGTQTLRSYWEVPAKVQDRPAAFRTWAQGAQGASRRLNARKAAVRMWNPRP